ncbi:hypothetical protein FNV43_RR08260 [Rhamnella rubrinervis]|uniref:Reverse transcriptase n=1 Tax=Rhamnella rubrinervis TaxID=2594499 RepID=A0A8K0HG62_9ROSA|nr:hypothetical protein FNV43_RR08260 [Rhamnella rubrinervis]
MDFESGIELWLRSPDRLENKVLSRKKESGDSEQPIKAKTGLVERSPLQISSVRNPPLILTQGIKERTGEVVVSGTGPGEATGYGAESVREGRLENVYEEGEHGVSNSLPADEEAVHLINETQIGPPRNGCKVSLCLEGGFHSNSSPSDVEGSRCFYVGSGEVLSSLVTASVPVRAVPFSRKPNILCLVELLGFGSWSTPALCSASASPVISSVMRSAFHVEELLRPYNASPLPGVEVPQFEFYLPGPGSFLPCAWILRPAIDPVVSVYACDPVIELASMRGLPGLSSKATITRTIGKRDFTPESLTTAESFPTIGSSPSDIRSFCYLNRGGVAFDVVPAPPDSIHSPEPIAVLRSERIDLSLGLSNSISGSDLISYDDIFYGIVEVEDMHIVQITPIELTSRAEKENFIDLRHGTKAPLLARLVHGTYPIMSIQERKKGMSGLSFMNSMISCAMTSFIHSDHTLTPLIKSFFRVLPEPKFLTLSVRMPVTKNLGKSLGVPLIHERVSRRTYADFLEKVQGRLSGWKAKLLNMAGRETLIQSTTFALPMYTMQTALLPQKVCDELDRMNRNFLWGSTDEKGKVHLVGWHHITKSGLRGGWGIRSARRCKIAMLGKLDWALNHGLSEPRTLSIEALTNLIAESGSLFPVGLAKPRSLYFSRVRPSFLSLSD